MRYFFLSFRATKDSFELNYRRGTDENHGHDKQSAWFPVEYPKQAIEAYEDWQECYDNLLDSYSKDNLKKNKEDVRAKFQNSLDKLNKWFESVMINDLSLQDIIKDELAKRGKLRLLIESEEADIQKLFWSQLDIFKNKDNVGIVFSIPGLVPEHTNISSEYFQNDQTDKISILVVCGRELNSDSEVKKWEEWKKEMEKTKEKKNSELIITIESPETYEELVNYVEKYTYDLIYFTGHGSSPAIKSSDNERNDNLQTINVCENTILVRQFYGLINKAATNNYLKLMILSCCDGSVLAQNLINMGVPQVLFIRERILAEDARKFLQVFLEECKKEPYIHISHHKTQLALSLAHNQESLYGSCSITALFHASKIIPPLIRKKSPQTLVTASRNEFIFTEINILINWFLTNWIPIIITVVIGFLSGWIIRNNQYSQKIQDSVKYTVDIYVDNKEHFTGYFLDKTKNNNSEKKYTYTIVLPKELIDDLASQKPIEIKTEQNEVVTKQSIRLNMDDMPNNYPPFLTISFQSDKEYNFPEFETKAMSELFSVQNPSIPFVADTRVLVYGKELDNPQAKLFDPTWGVLIARKEQSRITGTEKKYLYFGYVRLSKLIENFKNDRNDIEIHTFKNEVFYTKAYQNTDDKDYSSKSSNKQTSFNKVFIPKDINDKNRKNAIMLFSFSSDELYDCFQFSDKIEQLGQKDLEEILKPILNNK
jgi:hypothetical protein